MDTHKAGPPQSQGLGVRVDCVVRREHASPHNEIQEIGGRSRDGERWRLSEDAAIAAIETEGATLYVEWPKGHRVDLVIAQGLGKRYLRTEADGESPDTLLALPDCE
jgi:hypothetical protein